MLGSGGSLAVTKIREVFRRENRPLTLVEIRSFIPEITRSQISSTLCYLLKQKYVVRELVSVDNIRNHRSVWQYTYSDSRFTRDYT